MHKRICPGNVRTSSSVCMLDGLVRPVFGTPYRCMEHNRLVMLITPQRPRHTTATAQVCVQTFGGFPSMP